ncbi:hypothetical protein BDK51DRAFT_29282 [Blyttiomyces helicus]|uniref:Uncharacterized protein n=1 Tax=Blyttiomyces helicus TaxID=388810 RepID=A0A4P9WLB5_9FUNG|nr:hypothetical protein BDK51DRAFT_29282 [Blyttiomyces helicus]|eukprot:RKO93192.1 hypothetical protein BDK51DRAFT_29282 [Blyttiomyces helicus]
MSDTEWVRGVGCWREGRQLLQAVGNEGGRFGPVGSGYPWVEPLLLYGCSSFGFKAGVQGALAPSSSAAEANEHILSWYQEDPSCQGCLKERGVESHGRDASRYSHHQQLGLQEPLLGPKHDREQLQGSYGLYLTPQKTSLSANKQTRVPEVMTMPTPKPWWVLGDGSGGSAESRGFIPSLSDSPPTASSLQAALATMEVEAKHLSNKSAPTDKEMETCIANCGPNEVTLLVRPLPDQAARPLWKSGVSAAKGMDQELDVYSLDKESKVRKEDCKNLATNGTNADGDAIVDVEWDSASNFLGKGWMCLAAEQLYSHTCPPHSPPPPFCPAVDASAILYLYSGTAVSDTLHGAHGVWNKAATKTTSKSLLAAKPKAKKRQAAALVPRMPRRATHAPRSSRWPKQTSLWRLSVPANGSPRGKTRTNHTNGPK